MDVYQYVAPKREAEKRIVEEWRKIGAKLGYDEKEMRRQHIESHGLEHVLGCSWYRCILHKQIPHIRQTMFQDTNQCGQVQYCSGESVDVYFTLNLVLRYALL